MSRPYVIDLFAGGGGFSLGAHLAGFRTAVAVELDPDLAYSYSANFPRTPLMIADLQKTRPDEILDQASCSVDDLTGLIGGPPCQGFSVIGKRQASDPRNALVERFFQIVSALSPPFFVMENVPGILAPLHRPLLDKQLRKLSRLYHLTGPLVLDAVNFGVATRRRRAIVVGIKKTVGLPLRADSLLKPTGRPLTVAEAFTALPLMEDAWPDDDGDFWAEYPKNLDTESLPAFVRWALSPPPSLLGSREARSNHRTGITSGFQPTLHSAAVRQRFANVSPGSSDEISRYPRLSWDAPAPTLRAGTGRDRGSYQAARPIHPVEPRVITVREAARIQGFPDWFRFHPAKWHSFRMIGNSVSPIFAATILRAVRSNLAASRGGARQKLDSSDRSDCSLRSLER